MLEPIIPASNELIRVGPFLLTGEIGIASLASLVALVAIAVKLIRHLTIVDARVAQLWKSLMGEGPADVKSFFYRFTVMEQRIGTMWRRLKFDHLPPEDQP